MVKRKPMLKLKHTKIDTSYYCHHKALEKDPFSHPYVHILVTLSSFKYNIAFSCTIGYSMCYNWT